MKKLKKQTKEIKVNKFLIRPKMVYEVIALNGNGAGAYVNSKTEAIKWAREYSWFD